MEKIIFINKGVAFEYNEGGLSHHLGTEESFEKGPRLTQKRVVIAKTSTPCVYRIFVQTHKNLWHDMGCICVLDDHVLPKKLHVRGSGDTTIPIEEGSLLHEALRAYFSFDDTLAEEICKAPDNSEESYW